MTQKKNNSIYHVLGLMSGTSLDGLDLAYVRFEQARGQWQYELLSAETVPYPRPLQLQLEQVGGRSALELAVADVKLGEFMGQESKRFMAQNGCDPLLIASHGHTIFHRPGIGLTTQIGSGAVLAALAGRPVACDFRSADVALGGQGAPLVPIGDRLLFSDYHFCLNLGGIANISFEHHGQRVAFDISACNMALNRLAAQLDQPYDDGGRMAREGRPDSDLLEQLNGLPYFRQPFPKSLGREWAEQELFPLLDQAELRVRDKLATVCHHIAMQVAKAVGEALGDDAATAKKGHKHRLLITGGGAFNRYLVEQINLHNPQLNVTVPHPKLIAFKEAVVFAFLGLLRWRGEPNALRSVTGAQRDACTGALHAP